MDSHLVPGDPILVENIVRYLKAMGIFDEFRHECLADVDTKSSYQNLSQRVDGYTSKFLAAEAWNPDLNKNEMRNKLRKHIDESGMLAGGTDHVVEQVINPKIPQTMFPKIIEVVHQYLAKEKEKLNKREIVNQEKIATETAPKPKTTVLDPIAEILSFTYAKPKSTNPPPNAQAKNSEASKGEKKKEEASHQTKISDSKAEKKKEDISRPIKPPIAATKVKKEVPDQTLATEAVPNVEKKEDIAISVKVEPVETKELSSSSVSSTPQTRSTDEDKEPEKVLKSLKVEELGTTGFETPIKVEKDDVKHEKKKAENLKWQIPENTQSDDSNEAKSSPFVKNSSSGKIKPESSKHKRNKPLGLGIQRTSSKVVEACKSNVKESSNSSSEKVSSDQNSKPLIKLPSNESKDLSLLKNTISAKMVKCEKAGESSKSKSTPTKSSDKHSSSKLGSLKKEASPLKSKQSLEKHEKAKAMKDSKTHSESPSIKPSSSSYDSSQGSDPGRSSSSSSSSKEKLKHFSKHHRKDSSSTDTSSKSSSDKKQPQSDTEAGTLKSDKGHKGTKHSSTDDKKKFTAEESAKITARSDSIGSMSSTSDSQASLKETSSISDSQASIKESSASGETSDTSSRSSKKKKRSSRSSKDPCSELKDMRPPSPPSPSSGLLTLDPSSSAELSSQDETQSSQESRESEDESSEGGSSGSEEDNSGESASEEMTLKTTALFSSGDLNPFLHSSSSSSEFEGFNSSPEKGAKAAASDVSSVHTSDLSSFEDELSDVEAEDEQLLEGKKRLTLKEAEKILKAKAEKKILEATKTTPQKAPEDIKQMKSSPQGSETPTPTALTSKVDVSPTPEPKRESRRERKLNPKYASSEYKSIFDSKRTTFITKQNNQTDIKSPADFSPVKDTALTKRKSSVIDKSPPKVADLPLEESSKSSSSSVVLEYSSEDISTFGIVNSEIKLDNHAETDTPNRIALKIKLSATKNNNKTNKDTHHSQGTKRKLDLGDDKSSGKKTCLRNSVNLGITANENKPLNIKSKNPSGVLGVNRVTDKEVFNKQKLNNNGDILSKMEHVKRNSISKSSHVHEKQNRD